MERICIGRISAMAALLALMPACFGGFISDPIQPPDGDADAGDGAEGDVSVDRDLPDDTGEIDPGPDPSDADGEEASCGEPCTPGQVRCGDGSLETCSGDGCGYDPSPCLMGCLDSPEPHCASLVPSNVNDPGLLCAGTADLDLPTSAFDYVVFNTDDGSISVLSDGTASEMRPAGEGDQGGIVFTLQDQADDAAPGLGIFSFRSFTVPAGVLAVAVGGSALVVLSCEDMVIEGTVSVASRSSWELYDRQTGGPGGGHGGVMTDESGTGPGAGGGGLNGPDPTDTGGGGAGFGGGGGTGGAINVTTSTVLDGGAGGSVYGNETLIPLLGGSGGGAGSYNTGDLGTPGAGGGGALQLVSAVGIEVRAGGALDAGGGGGGGGRSIPSGQGGGGGGGSGGGILMEAPGIVIQGSVTAAGGGGGAGGNENEEGQPGEDGFLVLGSAAGGTGALTATSGGDGSGPSSGNGTDGENEGIAGGKNDSGGGGGGAGKVRLNTMSGADLSGGTFHPPPAGGLFTEGDLTLQ